MNEDDLTTQLVTGAEPVPGYSILKQLGVGGMATVYLAREESLDRLVALKIMDQKLLDKKLLAAEFLSRFAAEAKTAAQLRHPNIVVVHANGEANGLPYIAFEYVEGGDLQGRLDREGALPRQEATSIAASLADALDYLHAREVVHRDVKPANIIFNSEGRPVLSDFGIAMALSNDERLTQAGMAIGSPAYMSPEQLRGGEVTPKSDIYSFGLVLLEMLGGRLPPDGDPLSLASRAGDLAGLVRSCLSNVAEERPTASECRERIENLGTASVEKSRRKHVWPLAGLLIVVLLVWSVQRLQEPHRVSIDVIPPQATLFLGSERLDTPSVLVGETPQSLVVVSAGYRGVIRAITAETPASLSVELDPLPLPDAQQYLDFHNQFDQVKFLATEDSSPEIRRTGYGLYDQLLEVRAALVAESLGDTIHQEHQTEQLRDIQSLATAGDAAAQLGAFLLASEGFVNIDSAQLEVWLKNASASSGFALATFYRALHLRATEESNGSFDAVQEKAYGDLMRLARRQGLGFTPEILRTLIDGPKSTQ